MAKGHGIAEALYVGGPGVPYYKPYIECLCGWHTVNGGVYSWEEAGAELDEHLEEVEKKRVLRNERRKELRQINAQTRRA